MDSNERQVIDDLFTKLRRVEGQSAPRDADAEAAIRSYISSQPGAPYYMAQTIVVQEQALEAAQARIEELERRRSQPGGGFLASLFGGGARPSEPMRPFPGRAAPMQGGIPGQRPGRGFLAGAAQTAMGVAGGVLLGNAIAGLLTPDAASAAEQPAEDSGTDGSDGFGDEEF